MLLCDSNPLPSSFEGTSGGGIWGLKVHRKKSNNKLVIGRSALVGVQFYQTALKKRISDTCAVTLFDPFTSWVGKISGLSGDTSGTTRSCGRRLLRDAKRCDDAGRLRRVSIFDGSASSWADRRNLCRESLTSGGRRILLPVESQRVHRDLICRLASTARPSRATRFRRPSSCRFQGNHFP